jgi:hypothetical protein
VKKHLKIFVFFNNKEEKTQFDQTTGRCHRVMVDTFKLIADTTGLDCVDAHFLSQIVSGYTKTQDDLCNAPGYDGVWAQGLKEFMWRIGYEIEFVNIEPKEGWKRHNEFTQDNPFGWLDFRSGYPRYEHRK